MPPGLYAPQLFRIPLDAPARAHHLIGDVEAQVAGPDVGDYFYEHVFRSAVDARASFRRELRIHAKGHVRLLPGGVPGYPVREGQMGTGILTYHGRTYGVTHGILLQGNVIVEASAVTHADQPRDIRATVKLLQTGVRYLHHALVSGALTAMPETTPNWSGYAVTGGHYTRVSASWVQPALNCSATPVGHSAFWAGLDGFSSDGNSVEQTGTEGYCSHGKPTYFAWWDVWPKPKYYYFAPVKPGDKLFASVIADGNGHFTLIVADRSEGWTRRTPATLRTAKLATAEVIAEAPGDYVTHRPVPLADFGTVRFTHVSVNGKSFSDLTGRHPIYMVRSGTLRAAPRPTVEGALTVTWKHP